MANPIFKTLEQAHAITPSIENRIDRVTQSLDSTFAHLIQIGGLDPKNDFRYTDLSGVDFSNSDLRGFDFQGSDLRGAHGFNVRFDLTTNLRGADVDGSMFAHAARIQHLWRRFPQWHSYYERLKDAHWTEIDDWVANYLRPDSADREPAWMVSSRLFDEAPSAQRSILYFSSKSFPSSEEYRDFLVHYLTSSRIERPTKTTILDILADKFYNDESAFNTLRMHLRHSEPKLRQAAARGLLNSRFYSQHADEIERQLFKDEEDRANRQYIVGRIARRMRARTGKPYDLAVHDPQHFPAMNYIDYRVPITTRMIEAITRNWIRKESAEAELGEKRAPRNYEVNANLVRTLLEEMRDRGVPFSIEPILLPPNWGTF